MENLIKKLEKIKNVRIDSWYMIPKIVDFLNSNKGEILFVEKYDQWFKYGQNLDLLNINTWSTYDNCVDTTFTLLNNKLHTTCFIWNGDNFKGFRTEKKFKAELLLDISFIENIDSCIESKFDDYLENLYEEHLKIQKKKWIQKKKIQLLNIK